MLNFYVMDGKKLIDFKPKWINYVRALDRRCKMAGFWGNMTIQEAKSAYPDELKKDYKYFEQYKNAGINSACFGTGIPEYDADKMKYYLVSMGKFRIKIFPLVHDVPCYGFYITHPEMGSLVYASDTEYIKYRFKNVNHFMVESNYDMQFVDRDEPNYEHRLRGHMSLDTALKFISTNDNPALRNVVLIHLSDKSGDPALFKQKTEETVKYGANVYIAEKGLEVDMNLCPF